MRIVSLNHGLDHEFTPSLFSDFIDVIQHVSGLSLNNPSEIQQLVSVILEINNHGHFGDFLTELDQRQISPELVLELLSKLKNQGILDNSASNFLLSNTSSLTEGKQWPLIEVNKSSTSIPVGLFALEGKFGLNAFVNAKYYEQVESLAGKLDSPNELMGYQFDANTTIEGKLSASLLAGAFSANLQAGASGQAQAQVSIYCNANQDDLVAQTLYKHLKQFDDIANLTAFKSGDVKALSVDFSGAIKAWCDVDLGYSYTFAKPSVNATPNIAKVTAGVSAGASWSLSGDLSLLVYKQNHDAQSLTVEVVKQKTQQSERYLQLGGSAETEGVKEFAQQYLQQLAEYSEELKKLIEEFSDPKQKITKIVNAHLESLPNWQESLGLVITGQPPINDIKQDVVEKVAAKLSIYFDDVNSWLDDQAKVAQLAKEVAALLGMENSAEVVENSQQLISQSVASWLEQQKEVVTDWVANNTEAALKPLEQFGAKVDGGLNTLNDKVRYYFDALLKLRSNFQRKLNLISEFVNNTLVEEVGVSYRQSQTSIEEQQALLKISLHLSAEANEVANVFAECITGDFRKICQWHQQQSHDHVFTLENCLFKNMLSKTRKASMSFNLFGLNADKGVVLHEKASLHYDGNGRILVFKGKADFLSYKASGNERSEVVTSNVVDLLAQHNASFKVRASYRDSDLTTEELFGFLHVLEKSELVKPDTRKVIKQSLADQQLINQELDKTVLINAVLTIPAEPLQHLLGQTQESVIEAAVQAQCDAYLDYISVESKAYTLHQVLRVLSHIDTSKSLANNVHMLAAINTSDKVTKIKKVIKKLIPGVPNSYLKKIATKASLLVQSMDENSYELVQLLDELKTLQTMQPPGNVTSASAGAFKKQLASALASINDRQKSWIKPGKSILQKDIERLHPCSVAFILVLKRLAEIDDLVVPMAYQLTDDGKAVPIITL